MARAFPLLGPAKKKTGKQKSMTLIPFADACSLQAYGYFPSSHLGH